MKNILPIYLLLACLVLGTLLVSCSREEPPPVPAPAERTVTPAAPSPTPVSPAAPPAVEPRASVPPAPSSVRPAALLTEPLPLRRGEVPAEALAIWRAYASQKPTLLILSNNPMLAPVPETIRNEVRDLVTQGDVEALRRRGSLQVADPLLMPNMTVTAALQSGLLSQVVWALPLRDSSKEISSEVFLRNLGANALLGEDELRRLKVAKHLVRGAVRGTPLLVAALDKLPLLSGPVIVHIDQSYFQDRYKNEVATPLLGMVYDVLYQLREKRLPVLAVTFAYGNLEERIALDVRFLGEVLAHFIEHPERSKEPVPLNWQRMADIFHLQSLFETEKLRDLAMAMERDDPESAWVKFALYRAATVRKAGEVALEYLAEAVRRDRIYAVEYLNLAQMAYDKKRSDAALQMLQSAADAFPDNPQITLKIAQLTAERGDRKAALQLVGELQQLPWSPLYFLRMPDYLKSFSEFLQKEPPPSVSPAKAQPRAEPPENSAESKEAILPAGHPGVKLPGHP